MSAITETERGEQMVCILGFSASLRGDDNQPIPVRRKFHIGERVRYITYFYKDTPADNPTGYMAIFEPIDREDHIRYAATQNYFVSLDCWEGLRKHFVNTHPKAVESDSLADRTKTPSRVAVKVAGATRVATQPSPSLPTRKPSRGKSLPKAP